MVRGRPQFPREFGNGQHAVLVLLRDGGIDLKRQARHAAGPHPGHGPRPGGRRTAQGVVKSRIGAVQRNPGSRQPRLFQTRGDGMGDKRPVAPEYRSQPSGPRRREQIEEVFSEQGLSAGKDDDLEADRGELVEKGQPLRGRKFLGVRAELRVAVAVPAREVAVARDIPRHQRGLKFPPPPRFLPRLRHVLAFPPLPFPAGARFHGAFMGHRRPVRGGTPLRS